MGVMQISCVFVVHEVLEHVVVPSHIDGVQSVTPKFIPVSPSVIHVGVQHCAQPTYPEQRVVCLPMAVCCKLSNR